MINRKWIKGIAIAVLFAVTLSAGTVVIIASILSSATEVPDIKVRDIRHLAPDEQALILSALNVTAAQKSAKVAELALFVSAVGMIGLTMTILASFYSMYQTRQIFDSQAQHTHDELRAYLAVSAHIVNVGLGKKPVLKIEIKNMGSTPAKNAKIGLALAYQFAGDDKNLDYSYTKDLFDPIIIQPGNSASAKITHHNTLTEEQISELNNMENHSGHILTAVGGIEYETYAGKQRETWFAFCFYGPGCEEKSNLPKHNGAT
jgi:hypothetical protein